MFRILYVRLYGLLARVAKVFGFVEGFFCYKTYIKIFLIFNDVSKK